MDAMQSDRTGPRDRRCSARWTVGCPPRLADALRYAVFPGGARIRPRLCLAVAPACGDDDPAASDAAAAAIELLHCASLVHDDLPCFDDADLRRGRPSVHRAFGEPLAVLAGDALIVLAFETLARGARRCARRGSVALVRIIGRVRRRAAAASSPARPGNARAPSTCRLPARQDRRAVRGRHVAGAAAAGAEPRALARPRRIARRGLPGRRRHSRRRVSPARRSASRSAGTPRSAGRAPSCELGLDGAVQRLERPRRRGRRQPIPACPGEAASARGDPSTRRSRFLPAEPASRRAA